MGLLPCLRRGSERWWLPRSRLATEALGRVMVAWGRSRTADDIGGHVRQFVRRTLSLDPPLLIYAALSWPEEEADPAQLSDWLIDHAVRRFSSGDAFLGAPLIDGATRRRWKQIRDHYKTLAFQHWLRDAPLWLEVTGPAVSAGWQSQWPQLNPSSSAEPVSGEPLETAHDCMLQQLARSMQHQRATDQAQDRALQKIKMGSLKQLAYGLSHEINNPLANISTRAQQLQRQEPDESRSAILQRIVDQVYRAHEMIADLMFYANPPQPAFESFDLNRTLADAVEAFREEADRQAIRLEMRAPDEPTLASVDGPMVSEAVAALIRNSIEAIGCQGTIVVSLVAESDRLLIHVADSGPRAF